MKVLFVQIKVNEKLFVQILLFLRKKIPSMRESFLFAGKNFCDKICEKFWCEI